MNLLRQLLNSAPPVLGRWNYVLKKENAKKFMDQNKQIRNNSVILDKKTIGKLRNHFKNKK